MLLQNTSLYICGNSKYAVRSLCKIIQNYVNNKINNFNFLTMFYYKPWSNITPLYFFSSNIIYFGQKQPIKVQIFEIFESSGQNLSNYSCQFWTDKSSSSLFASLFIVNTHNSPVKLKLIHNLLLTKRCYQSHNFETFKCSGESFPNFSCHFWKHKSVFLQTLNQSWVSSNITPLYFLSWNIIYFGQKQPIKVQIFEIFEYSGQNLLNYSFQFWTDKSSSSFFAPFFIVIEHKSPVNVKLIHILLCTNRCHQSHNF